MAEREKVIDTFEKIISVCKEDGCDFVDLTFEDAEQILAMLKEQEAVEPFHDEDGAYWCSSCHEDIVWRQKYCSNCGNPISWEGR